MLNTKKAIVCIQINMRSHNFQILQEHILNNSLIKSVILCFQRSRIAGCLLQGNPRVCERLPTLSWKTWELAELQLFPLNLIGFQEYMTLLRAMLALNLGCILPALSSWRLNSTVYVRPQPLGEFLPQYRRGIVTLPLTDTHLHETPAALSTHQTRSF